MATVRYFAAAAEAAGTESERVNADDLGSLKERLVELHGAELARVLGLSSVLHEGQYVSDPATALAHDAVVDVLPPFAGG
ncbi:MoaD/ThiS family protein [Ornithinimicrobium tianjinense]|uniref:Molybdenum cofactor biosynthesis protein D2 (MoaD2) / thiamineS n=2 Tax=Ornithinimicrobium tianjinense TaxID=1195761 RepID=A0A917BXR7_9MICO|nr:MoaD/ThiS family protein [Ornithinimicrobium tianjinense]GGF60402.1 putative molybdenum cofactor biosynthesis protein D2 (MoaD2) / thiamineS [Ornithinimicrobium tianjinense]